MTTFNYRNPIVAEDMRNIFGVNLEWNNLKGKRILVTGANGMLATYIVYFLAFLNENGIENEVLALSRNLKKSEMLFSGLSNVELIASDIALPLNINGQIDYILHFAGNASPYAISHTPTDIVNSNLLGTLNVVELSRQKGSKIIFASTREVYGEVKGKSLLSENDFGNINPCASRSCYPESKRAAETILMSNFLEHNVPFISIRLAHAYGPGMKTEKDGRVMADFVGAALRKETIVLHSDGTAERAFCYISDAVSGIFYVMLRGEVGEAYNLSNEDEPITIGSLAKMIAQESGITLEFDIPKTQSSAYCAYERVGLDTQKLRKLGWKPKVNIQKGVKRTINI